MPDVILDEVQRSARFFSQLSERWEDEHEYEDPSEYSAVFVKNFPSLVVDRVHSSSKYLGFDIHHIDEPKRIFHFKTTARSVTLMETVA